MKKEYFTIECVINSKESHHVEYKHVKMDFQFSDNTLFVDRIESLDPSKGHVKAFIKALTLEACKVGFKIELFAIPDDDSMRRRWVKFFRKLGFKINYNLVTEFTGMTIWEINRSFRDELIFEPA